MAWIDTTPTADRRRAAGASRTAARAWLRGKARITAAAIALVALLALGSVTPSALLVLLMVVLIVAVVVGGAILLADRRAGARRAAHGAALLGRLPERQ